MAMVDLYQLHRKDYDTPDQGGAQYVRRRGQTGTDHYPGTSSCWTLQFAKAQYTASHLGLEWFVSIQDHYNLTYREDERR